MVKYKIIYYFERSEKTKSSKDCHNQGYVKKEYFLEIFTEKCDDDIT